MKPVNPEQVQQTAQIMLAFLSEETTSIPGNMAEGIVSGKSLLRGIVGQQLFVCQPEQKAPKKEPDLLEPKEPVEGDDAPPAGDGAEAK